MAVTVRKITLWRKEVENRPGVLAGALGALADAGTSLQVVMAYRYPGNETRGAIELYPVATKKVAVAAQAAGMSASTIPTLLVQGDDRPGLGHAIGQAIADAGINVGFLVTQVIGRKYSAVIGFDSEQDARNAAAPIRKASARKKK